MTARQYVNSKSSGVDWVGDIPAHWAVSSLRSLVRDINTKNEGLRSENYLSLMANVGVILYADKGDIGNKAPEDLTKCKLVSVNDFVINSMNYGIGSFGISPYDGICSPVYVVLRTRQHAEVRFLRRVLECRPFQRAAQSFGNGILEHRRAIGWEILKNLRVAVPPIEEQEQIADALDAQTAKIDALIGKQERLIETLAERRQAIISHAVTKGLDPHAPMSDSGVEWLGDVPSSWVVQRLRHVTDVLTGFPFKSEKYSSDEADIRLLRGVNVNPGRLFWGEVVYWPRSRDVSYTEYLLRKDDLVLGLDRPIVSAGTRVARVQSEDLPALLLQRVARIRPKRGSNARFLEYLLSGPEFRDYLAPIFTGVSVPHMSPDQLSSFQVAVPIATEQIEIVEYLDRETSQIDALSAKAREMIDVLKERRQALISAAVTGKIDVRGLS